MLRSFWSTPRHSTLVVTNCFPNSLLSILLLHLRLIVQNGIVICLKTVDISSVCRFVSHIKCKILEFLAKTCSIKTFCWYVQYRIFAAQQIMRINIGHCFIAVNKSLKINSSVSFRYLTITTLVLPDSPSWRCLVFYLRQSESGHTVLRIPFNC